MALIKTDEDIAYIRQAGLILAQSLVDVLQYVEEGNNAYDIDKQLESFLIARGGRPAFKNYKPPFMPVAYPAASCISINDEVVHGLPSKDKVLKKGDLVTIDAGVELNGRYADAAISIVVGDFKNNLDKKLFDAGYKALIEASKLMIEGNTLGDIGFIIESIAKKSGFDVVRSYSGHGVGNDIHEEPEVLNFGRPKKGMRLRENMVLAIEPMLTIGRADVYTKKDGWTVATKSGKNSIHFEFTVAVGRENFEILTPWHELLKEVK